MNGTHKMRNREFTKLVAMKISDFRKVSTSDTDNNISGSFYDEKFLAALQYLKSGKASGPVGIYLELIKNTGNALKSCLRSFLSSCFKQLKIPKNLAKCASSFNP